MRRASLILASIFFGLVLAIGAPRAVAQAFISNRVAGAVLPGHVSDAVGFTSPVIDMDHYSSASVTSFGINVRNQADNPAAPTAGSGANSALVLHQYSDMGPAVQIDNTRSKPFITMKEASNGTNSVGTQGTGDFLELWGYTASNPGPDPSQIARLDQFLAFRGLDSSRPWQFIAQTTGPALQIVQANAGNGLVFNQSGAGNAINVSQTGAASAVAIIPGAGADGFAPLLVSGRTHGAAISTSQSASGQYVLQVAKNGTSAGDALVVINKGTDKSLRGQNAAGDTFSFGPNGELTIGAGGTAISKSVRGTITWAPGSIAAGSLASNSITVTGAVTGADCIAGVTSPAPLTGYAVQCIVTAANTCGIAILNQSSTASASLGSATWYCRVFNP